MAYVGGEQLAKTPLGVFKAHEAYTKLKEAGIPIEGNYQRLEVEVERYEPIPDKPGYVRHIGNKTVGEIWAEIKALLPYYIKPTEDGTTWEGRFDYIGLSACGINSDAEFPCDSYIKCFVLKGGSEGHYLRVECDGKIIYLGKTFLGAGLAWEVAMAIATILDA